MVGLHVVSDGPVGGPLLLITAVDVMDTVAVTDAVPPTELTAVPIDPVAGYEAEDAFVNGGKTPLLI